MQPQLAFCKQMILHANLLGRHWAQIGTRLMLGSTFAAEHLPPFNSPFGGQVFGPDRHEVHAGIVFCSGAFAVGQLAQVLPLELRAAPQPPRGELAAVHVAARQQHAHTHLRGSCQVLNGRCRKLDAEWAIVDCESVDNQQRMLCTKTPCLCTCRFNVNCTVAPPRDTYICLRSNFYQRRTQALARTLGVLQDQTCPPLCTS